MKRYDVESCIEVLFEHTDTRDHAADILDKLEPIMFNQEGCSCCEGDDPLFWEDNENCAFVDNKGEILAIARDKTLRFKVDFCPKCGRKFEKS